MNITTVQLGRLLGLFLALLILIGVPYLVTAFVTWQADPGEWTTAARGLAIGSALLLIGFRFGAGRIVIIRDRNEEQR